MVFRIPGDDESLFHFGEAPHEGLPGEALKVLIWNVWKGKGKDPWRKDLAQLSGDRDLILLQEAVSAPHMTEIFHESKGRHEWHMAASFLWNTDDSHHTGVITGSSAKTKERRFLRGKERELFLFTPKVSLSSLFGVQERDSALLVVNTHVVNFTTTASFVVFVNELVSLVAHHSGPVIVAGDFNTWNFRRTHELLKILAKLGLEQITFPGDPRFLKLDHVFVRGFVVDRSAVLAEIKSSDHFPLLVDLRYK